MLRLGAILNELDHCRIGSLENFGAEAPDGVTRSLPHRQLRNEYHTIVSAFDGSLPHRQLRNCLC